MSRLPKRLRHKGLSPEDIKEELEADLEERQRRDLYRAERVRHAKTYRYARRHGWRLLNEELVKQGRAPLSWSVFNQRQAQHQIGSPTPVYRGAKTRSSKTWENAFHHGEKKRRFLKLYGGMPEGTTA